MDLMHLPEGWRETKREQNKTKPKKIDIAYKFSNKINAFGREA